MGAPFLLGLPRAAGPLGVLVVGALAFGLLGPGGLAAVALPLVVAAAWTWFVARRLRGVTGDVLGSAVEVAEIGVLVMAAALAHRGAV
jgi:cobalamin synthase